MPLAFNSEYKKKTFYSNQLSTSHLHSTELTDITDDLVFANAGMRMQFRNWYFDGIRMANSSMQSSAPVDYSVSNDIDTVKFYFNTRGHSSITYHELGSTFDLQPGRYNLLYSSELNSHFQHRENFSDIFSLQLTRESFENLVQEDGGKDLQDFAKKLQDRKPVLFSDQWMPVKKEMDDCIRNILHCTHINHMKKLYLQSKANELFVLLVNQCYQQQPQPFIKKSSDRDLLIAIKAYLTQHYTTEISLPQLCKTFGINEFKLKKGFRELFSTSVIDLVISLRLEHARQLLLNTDLPISEVAFSTGYSSPRYFSKAFRKKYGVNPTGIN